MKKILPIISLLGVSVLIVGCSNNMDIKKESFINNINSFKQDVNNYTALNENNVVATALNKYTLSLENEFDNLLPIIENETKIDNLEENEVENAEILQLNETENTEITPENHEEFHEQEQFNEIINNEKVETIEEIENKENIQFSTLYTLSNDIDDSCEEFCDLKQEITHAIIETQNVLNKIQAKEIELTTEQRMIINEQSTQLKQLGRQLANITTELSINLSDLNQLMMINNQDFDSLSLKYLVVLDNLINGNEMLQSGLNSLNLINQMFNMNSSLPSNNRGRILYGFKQNNNPPVIKDYYIDENGNIKENSSENIEINQATQNDSNTENKEVEKKTNIDTYQNTALNSNIDSYYGNTPRNIDSFFNTALLNNEFMYGNNYNNAGYGMFNNANHYLAPYTNYQMNNANYSVNQNQQTQSVENKETKKEKKKKKLKKNIDTFKDENEPHIKEKLGKIKSSITGFLGKFKKSDLSDKVQNPVYKFNATTNEEID